MKLTKIKFLPLLMIVLLSMTSCSIEGEEVCGIWETTGDYGDLRLEIKPWQGKFHAYLLLFNGNDDTYNGQKLTDFVFITDLVYEDGSYKNGKIYVGNGPEDFCNLSLEMVNKNKVKAIYNCDGEHYEEFWLRAGHIQEEDQESPQKEDALADAEPEETEVNSSEKDAIPEETNETAALQADELPKATQVANKEEQPKKQVKEDPTRPHAAFNIIGYHKVVNYDDEKLLEKTLEDLWTQLYNKDFSGKLSNITEPNNIYTVFSDYGNPEGKMTITIGYRVKDLSGLQEGLHGLKILANDYYVYELSGQDSDYEGEGWDQLEQLIAYRKASSVDFEVYTLDNNYEVVKGEFWVGAK